MKLPLKHNVQLAIEILICFLILVSGFCFYYIKIVKMEKDLSAKSGVREPSPSPNPSPVPANALKKDLHPRPR